MELQTFKNALWAAYEGTADDRYKDLWDDIDRLGHFTYHCLVNHLRDHDKITKYKIGDLVYVKWIGNPPRKNDGRVVGIQDNMYLVMNINETIAYPYREDEIGPVL